MANISSKAPPEQLQKLGGLMSKLMQYKPDFSGPVTLQVSVRDMKAVWEKATAEKDGGAFLSQYGNKQWIWVVVATYLLGFLFSFLWIFTLIHEHIAWTTLNYCLLHELACYLYFPCALDQFRSKAPSSISTLR